MNSKLKFKKLLTVLTTLVLCLSSFTAVHADPKKGTYKSDYLKQNVLAVLHPQEDATFMHYVPYVADNGEIIYCSDDNYWKDVMGDPGAGIVALYDGDGTIMKKSIYNFLQSDVSYTPIRSGNFGGADAYYSGSLAKTAKDAVSNQVGYTLTDDDLAVATNYALHILAGNLTYDKLRADSIQYVQLCLGQASGDYSGLADLDLTNEQATSKFRAMMSLVNTLVQSMETEYTNSSLHVEDWSSNSDFKYPYVDSKTTISLKLPSEFTGDTFEAGVTGTTKIFQGSTTMVVAMNGVRPKLENLLLSLFPANSGVTAVTVNPTDIQSFVRDGASRSVEVKFDKISITVDRNKYASWLLSNPTITVPEQLLDNGFYMDPVAVNRTPQNYAGVDYQDMAAPELTQFKGVYFEVQIPEYENETVITKTSDTGAALAGVRIRLMDSAGNPVTVNAKNEPLNLTTDAEGKITLKNLKLDDYRYQEVEAPAGYVISSKTYSFKVTSTGSETDPTQADSTLNFTDELTTFVLIKNDEDNQPMEGVKFEVYNSAGSKVKEGITDAEGKITFKGLTGGESYTFKEVEIPAGYVKAQDAVASVEKADNKQAGSNTCGTAGNQPCNQLVVTNKKTEVNIKKADFADASPVAGAKIVIKDNAGAVKFEGTSNAEGDFGLPKGHLAVGSYTFTETVAPAGYKLNETTFAFTIEEDGTIVSEAKTGDKELTITDEKLDITLEKVDAKDNAGIDGVVVEVYDNAAPETKVTLTSADGGKLHFEVGDPFLKVGHTYTVKEKEAAPGYVVKDTEYTFTIANNGTITGSAARFSNDPTHVVLSKTEISTAAPVPGAKLSIYKLDDTAAVTAKGVELVDLVTAENGKVEFDYLPVGDYYFVETDAPEGYMLNPDKHYFSVNPDGTIAGKDTMSDELNKVEYIKLDGDTNDLLPGVEFELVDSSGKHITKNILGDPLNLVTGEDGKIILRGLGDGEYSLVEKTPVDGYYIDANPIKFSIVRGEEDHESKVIQDSVRITNAKTRVELKKLDVNGVNGVAGVTIELKDADGNVVTKNALGEDLVLVSDANGNFVFEGLKIGSYKYREVKVPHGYTVNQNEFAFEITKNGTVTGNKEFENSKTHVEIKKTDVADSAPIEGSEIEIFDAEGNSIAKYTSDKTGTFPIPDGTLAIGKYKFVETIAPEGYKLNETVFEFEILEDGAIEGATEIKNEKTLVVLHKFDKMQQINVPGALLEVYDKDGNIVTDYAESYFTDVDGNVTIVGLPVGEYTWKEAIAPQGYILNKEVKKFSIAPNGTVTGDVEMINTPNEIIITKINSTKTPKNASEKERVVVPGATFQFWKDNKEFGEYVTDEKGQIRLIAAQPGVYTYREIKAPVGFELNSETYTFTVKGDGTAEGVFLVSNKEVGLYLHKLSYTTGKPLAGAVFIVKDSTGKEVAKGTSDSNGLVLIQTLKAGKYTIEESSSPDGYVKVDQQFGFTINELGSVVEGDFTVYNKVKPKEDEKKREPVNTGFGQGTMLAAGLGASALAAAGILVAKRCGKKEED